MAKNYNTRTASLKATLADIRNLDAKQIKLKDKNILDYIKEAEFDSYDTRDPQLKNDELDIWNTEISLSDNGHIEVKPHVHGIKYYMGYIYEGVAESQVDTLKTAVKVIDNEVLGADDAHLMYWQSDGLTSSTCMFYQCENLTSFSSDLSNLTEGVAMFEGCYNLTSFSSDLSNLTEGDSMFFECSNLTSLSIDLPNLSMSYKMFSECSKLTSFKGDLSSLTDGESMFQGCTNLTSFSSDLSNLIYGDVMFFSCKLNAKSVANIVHTLPALESSDYITIGIGCDNTEADQLLFAQECHCDTWQELLDEFSAKNWTVEFQCNGRPTTTYNMRRGETLPVFVKIEEVIIPAEEEKKRHKPHYSHTSLDGSKFYQLTYFHSTNGSTEGYTQFNSIEEAEQYFEITPKQQIEK